MGSEAAAENAAGADSGEVTPGVQLSTPQNATTSAQASLNATTAAAPAAMTLSPSVPQSPSSASNGNSGAGAVSYAVPFPDVEMDVVQGGGGPSSALSATAPPHRSATPALLGGNPVDLPASVRLWAVLEAQRLGGRGSAIKGRLAALRVHNGTHVIPGATFAAPPTRSAATPGAALPRQTTTTASSPALSLRGGSRAPAWLEEAIVACLALDADRRITAGRLANLLRDARVTNSHSTAAASFAPSSMASSPAR
jgi:hypothetical protein